MAHGRPTLADVAATAGVSVSTASLAFSGAGPISVGTRDRVLAAAESLGYAGPNPLGRQLRRGRSGIVGVIVGDALRKAFHEPVTVQVLDGLVGRVADMGLGVLLIPGQSAHANGIDPIVETAAMDVAVMLWSCENDDPVLVTLRRRGIPTVQLEGPEAHGDVEGIATVGIADRSGTAALTRHLLELGHERIATVTLPMGPGKQAGPVDSGRIASATWILSPRRYAGITDAGVTPVVVWEASGSSVEQGAIAGKALLGSPDRPTAIIAQSDLLASGLVLAARELGLRVPDDVSIAGFDGLELPWLAPDVLTSVAQPLAHKGEVVAEAVATLLAGGTPVPVTIDVDLRIGTTTGPVPRG